MLSTRETSAGAHSQSLAPHNGHVTQPVFKTYASAAFDYPASLPLERSEFKQALIDVFLLISAVLFICITAASLPFAIFLMMVASF